MRPSKPILAAQPSCLCSPEIFCPFRTPTFFPEPGAMYECVSCGPNCLQWPRREAEVHGIQSEQSGLQLPSEILGRSLRSLATGLSSPVVRPVHAGVSAPAVPARLSPDCRRSGNIGEARLGLAEDQHSAPRKATAKAVAWGSHRFSLSLMVDATPDLLRQEAEQSFRLAVATLDAAIHDALVACCQELLDRTDEIEGAARSAPGSAE